MQPVKFQSRIDAGQKIVEEPQPEEDQSSDENNERLRPVPESPSQQATSHDGLFEG
jgi:hypothetical protein